MIEQKGVVVDEVVGSTGVEANTVVVESFGAVVVAAADASIVVAVKGRTTQ